MVAEEVVVPGAEEARHPAAEVYARHWFISWALTRGMNLKALAEYIGTSVAMIENNYGRFISDRGLAPLMSANGTAPSENAESRDLAGTFASNRPSQKEKASGSPRLTKWSQGESNRYRAMATERRKWPKYLLNRRILRFRWQRPSSPKRPEKALQGGENANRFEGLRTARRDQRLPICQGLN